MAKPYRRANRTALLPDGFGDYLRRRLLASLGILLILLAGASLLALLSFSATDPSSNRAVEANITNLLGQPGAYGADMMLQALGLAGGLVPLVIGIWGARLLTKTLLQQAWLRVAALLGALLFGAAAAQTVSSPDDWPITIGLGGIVGALSLALLVALVKPLLGVASIEIIGWFTGSVSLILLIYALGLSGRDWLGLWCNLYQLVQTLLRQGVRRMGNIATILLQLSHSAIIWLRAWIETQRVRRDERRVDPDIAEALGKDPAWRRIAATTIGAAQSWNQQHAIKDEEHLLVQETETILEVGRVTNIKNPIPESPKWISPTETEESIPAMETTLESGFDMPEMPNQDRTAHSFPTTSLTTATEEARIIEDWDLPIARNAVPRNATHGNATHGEESVSFLDAASLSIQEWGTEENWDSASIMSPHQAEPSLREESIRETAFAEPIPLALNNPSSDKSKFEVPESGGIPEYPQAYGPVAEALAKANATQAAFVNDTKPALLEPIADHNRMYPIASPSRESGAPHSNRSEIVETVSDIPQIPYTSVQSSADADDKTEINPKQVLQNQTNPPNDPMRPETVAETMAETMAGSGIDYHDFHNPPPDLLSAPQDHALGSALDTPENLRERAEQLEMVLQDFGIRGEITNARPGPVVTLFELEPAPGIRASRIIGLADDIARSMSAVSVRIAVVPGQTVIGIELPNLQRQAVHLRSLIEEEAYRDDSARLPLALGKDIGGAAVIADLVRMPHLLVAGTTGSGKSVAVNAMILSLLFRLGPERCRFIMIDPKMLELSVYNDIPHLLSPVVTDPKKAVTALKWAVREMEDRYKNMSLLGVRNVEGYNTRIAEARARGEILTRRVQTGFDPQSGRPIYEAQALSMESLPYIVIVVDEMADLMLVAGKEIEATIQRLAQMARAAGLHLIMATQRPSVDVITGTIKANFPTRISFQVTSKIDSRTILAEQGAEQLLGQGDMLFMAGGGRIRRVHGPFVSDLEVEKVTEYLKAQSRPQYVKSITEEVTEEVSEDNMVGGDNQGDELYESAVAVVTRERRASTSFVQRHLQIGYNRAARIIERMEREGIVGAANHVGKREILIRRSEQETAA